METISQETIMYYGELEIKNEFTSFLKNQENFDFEKKEIDLAKWNIMMIPFDMLYISERQKKSFSVEHVVDILSEFHPALHRPSSVIKYNGKYIIWDGHHSAAVARLVGMSGCPAVVYECDTISDFNDILDTATVEKIDYTQIMNILETDPVLTEKILQRIKK
jgi:hypothetical protein